MKYIRKVSDIHLDFDIRSAPKKFTHQEAMELCWTPPVMEGDDDTCLIVAGDIWFERRFLTKKDANGDSWLQKVARRFKYVVLVLGNHDYWDTNLLYEPKKVKEEITAQGITNAFLLEKDVLCLDQVKFVGGTLWTDFKRHDPIIMGMAPQIMNDYKYMRYGANYGKTHPSHVYEIFMNTKSFIFENAKKDYPDQTLIVVTHMAPSFKSIAPHFHSEIYSNFLYYSDLEKRILADGGEIDWWFHGHTHWKSDYMIGNVHVICNPRGYGAYEGDIGFDPRFRLVCD